jgi:ABC-2 type transport system ATP-binding protein
VIINRGRAIVNGSLDDLRERFRRIQFVFERDAPEINFRSSGVRRLWHNGRVLTVFAEANADRIVEEARAFNPTSVDMVPVTLKDIFLESAATED